MVLENPVPPFSEWLPGAIGGWLWVGAALAGFVIVVSLLSGIVRHGPPLAFARFGTFFVTAWRDWLATSPRRIWALALLAIRESVRNRIAVALAVFAALLMFAGWFMSGGDSPVKLYLDSIFQWSAMLVALVALLVAVFSLPGDIKQRTIYTVVTKPVRPQEIVLGRILGFGLVATGLLAVMLSGGYVFVGRMVAHDHAVDPESFVDLELPPPGGRFDENTLVETGRLATAGGHYHTFSLNAGGFGVSESSQGHWHAITKDIAPRVQSARADAGDATRVMVRFTEPMDPALAADPAQFRVTAPAGDLAVQSAAVSADNRTVALRLAGPAQVGAARVAVSDALTSRLGKKLAANEPLAIGDRDSPRDVEAYRVGPPEDMFRARVPLYGKLRFTGSSGEERTRGISVGDEWAYRSYISGATQASSIWRFEDVTPDRFGDFLRLEMTVAVFRTSKGRIEQTTRGTIVFRNPDDPKIATKPREFASRDGPTAPVVASRRLQGRGADGRSVELDLFDDLAPNGALEVVVQCSESGQLFGMAQADAYLLAREASYTWNYFKASLALVFPVWIVVAIAVTASTVLSSPVALLATLTYLLCGVFKTFVSQLAHNELFGGGPFEAAYRLQNRMNVMEKLPAGWQTTAVQMADKAARRLLQGMDLVLPDLTSFWRADYLAGGFFIPGAHLAMLALTTLGFLLPLAAAGYLLLKTREVAA